MGGLVGWFGSQVVAVVNSWDGGGLINWLQGTEFWKIGRYSCVWFVGSLVCWLIWPLDYKANDLQKQVSAIVNSCVGWY